MSNVLMNSTIGGRLSNGIAAAPIAMVTLVSKTDQNEAAMGMTG